jgi:hypothetical protein
MSINPVWMRECKKLTLKFLITGLLIILKENGIDPELLWKYYINYCNEKNTMQLFTSP